MTDDNLLKEFENFDKTISKFYEIDNKGVNISDLTFDEAKKLKLDLQNLYNGLIDVHFKVAKAIFIYNKEENDKITFNDGKSLTPKQVLTFSEKRASVIQFKYLYPLNVLLNEFGEADSKKRDEDYFIKSKKISFKYALISFAAGVFLSLVFSWFFSWYFDNDIDPPTQFEKNIKEEIEKIKSLQLENNNVVPEIEIINNKLDSISNKLNLKVK